MVVVLVSYARISIWVEYYYLAIAGYCYEQKRFE